MLHYEKRPRVHEMLELTCNSKDGVSEKCQSSGRR